MRTRAGTGRCELLRTWSGVRAATMAILGTLPTMIGCEVEERILPEPYELRVRLTTQVLSYPDAEPIPGAACSVVGHDIAATTDADGMCVIRGLLEGTYAIDAAAPGFASVRAPLEIDALGSISGDVRQHLTVYLVERSAELDLRIFDEDGAAMAGMALDVTSWSVPGSGGDAQVLMPPAPATFVADSTGRVAATGLPAAALQLHAPPRDTDDDGEPDTRGTTQTFELIADEMLSEEMVLPRAFHPSVWASGSNIPEHGVLQSCLAYLAFNVPMDTSQVATTVSLQADGAEVAARARWVRPTRLEITSCRPLHGEEVRLRPELRSRDGRDYARTFVFPWWTPPDCEPCPALCDSIIGSLRLANHAPSVDAATRELVLEWEAVPCGEAGYEIFARDDRHNPHWTLVGESDTPFPSGTVTEELTLPTTFDRYVADHILTPFAGIELEITVVPRGEPPDSRHAVLRLADETPPRATVTQLGPGRPGLSDVLDFRIEFTEYLDATELDFTIDVEESGGDPDYVLDPAQATWSWDEDRFAGTLSFPVDPAREVCGDRLRLALGTATDLSGNPFDGPVLEWTTVGCFALYDDFEGPDVWVTSGSGWERGDPRDGPRNAFSGENCWATWLHRNYPSNANTLLQSPEFAVPADDAELRFWCWYSIRTEDQCRLWIVEANNATHELATFTGAQRRWEERVFSLESFVGQTVRVRFEFRSDRSWNDDGFFFDLLRVRPGTEGVPRAF